MPASIRIHIIAITAGLFVGVVLQEVLLGIVNALLPETDLNRLLTGPGSNSGWLGWLILGWSIGGFAAGMMASMISRNLTSGCIAGALLMLPALVIAQFMFDTAPAAAAFTIHPLIAAALGSWLGGRLLHEPKPASRE